MNAVGPGAFEGVVVGAAAPFAPAMVDYELRMMAVRSRVFVIERNGAPLGTGILVAPALALTNYHVVKAFLGGSGEGLCGKFDYHNLWDPVRRVPFAKTWEKLYSPFSRLDYAAAEGGYTDAELDFALVQLAEPVGEQRIGENPLRADTDLRLRGWEMLCDAGLCAPGSPVSVVHHPGEYDAANGRIEQKVTALSPGRVLQWLDTDRRLRHSAVTQGGSSGGACLDEKLAFLGLHHMGDPTSPFRWIGKFNQAIPVNAILRAIAAAGKPEINDQLLKRSPDARGSRPPRIETSAAKNPEVIRLVGAANCLLDRDEAVRDLVLGLQVGGGLVQAMLCRYVDDFETLVTRLRFQALPLKGVPGGGRAALDRAAARELGWAGRSVLWPAADNDLKWAQDTLAYTLDDALDNDGYRGKPTLLVYTAVKAEWNPERDRALLPIFAALCKDKAGGQPFLALVVYHEEEAAEESVRDPAARDALSKLWTRETRPPHCGACLKLGDVGPEHLLQWSETLSLAWNLDQKRIKDETKGLLAGARLSMRALQDRLAPLIAGYAAEHLNSASETLR